MAAVKSGKQVKLDPELVKLADGLLANYRKPEYPIGASGPLKRLTKMLVERALETEMSEHLLHDKSEAITNATGNTCNGYIARTLQLDFESCRPISPSSARGPLAPAPGQASDLLDGF